MTDRGGKTTLRQARMVQPPERTRDLRAWVPKELRSLEDPQTAIPAIAKDSRLLSLIDNAVRSLPTTHDLFLKDARTLGDLKPKSVHLVLTSPPYWTLKEYRDSDGQLGHVSDYERFLAELDRVWTHCFRRGPTSSGWDT